MDDNSNPLHPRKKASTNTTSHHQLVSQPGTSSPHPYGVPGEFCTDQPVPTETSRSNSYFLPSWSDGSLAEEGADAASWRFIPPPPGMESSNEASVYMTSPLYSTSTSWEGETPHLVATGPTPLPTLTQSIRTPVDAHAHPQSVQPNAGAPDADHSWQVNESHPSVQSTAPPAAANQPPPAKAGRSRTRRQHKRQQRNKAAAAKAAALAAAAQGYAIPTPQLMWAWHPTVGWFVTHLPTEGTPFLPTTYPVYPALSVPSTTPPPEQPHQQAEATRHHSTGRTRQHRSVDCTSSGSTSALGEGAHLMSMATAPSLGFHDARRSLGRIDEHSRMVRSHEPVWGPDYVPAESLGERLPTFQGRGDMRHSVMAGDGIPRVRSLPDPKGLIHDSKESLNTLTTATGGGSQSIEHMMRDHNLRLALDMLCSSDDSDASGPRLRRQTISDAEVKEIFNSEVAKGMRDLNIGQLEGLGPHPGISQSDVQAVWGQTNHTDQPDPSQHN